MAESRSVQFRDLADFHLRWTEHRQIAREAVLCPGLNDDQRTVLSWLIALADRIGEADIAENGPPERAPPS